MTVAPFTRVVNPGSIDIGYSDAPSLAPMFAKIDWDGERLSICGVVGPLASGNARGSCGQIHGEVLASRSPSWAPGLYECFTAMWERWHLNDMQAACEHQRALGWTYDTHRGQDCPVCGYRIGSAWLHMDVPDDVLEFLRGLPISGRTPAWV